MKHIQAGFAAADREAASRRGRAEQTEELRRLRAELERTLHAGLEASAMKIAAAAVAKDMVAELAAEQAGQRIVRRLSDPSAKDARNASFAQRVQDVLKADRRYEAHFGPARRGELARSNKLK